MANDMIIVFNQLTKSDLSDCSVFEDIIEHHYEKFKFFYSLIKDLCFKNIDKIVCSEHTDRLSIFIHFKNKSLINKFNKILQELDTSTYINSHYFTLDINKNPDKINISIGNKSISKESEIYEN